MNQLKEFHKYSKFIQKQIKIGACTKQEGAIAMLGKAQECLEALKIVDPEEDNLYQAHYYN